MLKRILLIAPLLYFSSLSILSAAEVDDNFSDTWHVNMEEDLNAHFGLTIGQTDVKVGPFHDQGLQVRWGGGYRFSDFAAWDIGLVGYDKVNDTVNGEDTELGGVAFTVQLVGLLPVTRSIDIYCKAGVSYWRINVTKEIPGLTVQEKFDGTDPVYAAGFLFRVDHDSTLRLDYEIADYDGVDFISASFGFQHQF